MIYLIAAELKTKNIHRRDRRVNLLENIDISYIATYNRKFSESTEESCITIV